MKQEEIRERVKSIIQLPSLPAVAMEVMQVADDPKTSAAKLGRIIASDQALTAKVLKIANSPFYGFPKRISTVEFAIIVLGFDALKEIVMSIAMVASIQKGSDDFLDGRNYWDHAIATGGIARRIAQDTGYRVAGEVFVAGLLHDMGVSVLHRYFRKEFEEIVRVARDSQAPFLDAEQSVLGATHAEVGGWLAERWNLPDHLREAITFHHSPARAEQNPHLVGLVHCADLLAAQLGRPHPEFDQHMAADLDVLRTMGFDSLEALASYGIEMTEMSQAGERYLHTRMLNQQV